MNTRAQEYRQVIENLLAHVSLLDAEELMVLHELVSRAETKMLAEMADKFPDDH